LQHLWVGDGDQFVGAAVLNQLNQQVGANASGLSRRDGQA
jgi:hypothetical protein